MPGIMIEFIGTRAVQIARRSLIARRSFGKCLKNARSIFRSVVYEPIGLVRFVNEPSTSKGTGAIFNISKSSIPRCTISFPQKASRVCFTSAPKHSQVIRASKGDESFNKIKEGAGELKDNIEAKANEMAGRAADRAGEIKDIAADQVGEMKQSAQETASMASDKSEEGWSKAEETSTEAKDKTLDAAETVAEKTRQTVAGAWEAALETSEKIKETVVGSSEDVGKKD